MKTTMPGFRVILYSCFNTIFHLTEKATQICTPGGSNPLTKCNAVKVLVEVRLLAQPANISISDLIEHETRKNTADQNKLLKT